MNTDIFIEIKELNALLSTTNNNVNPTFHITNNANPGGLISINKNTSYDRLICLDCDTIPNYMNVKIKNDRGVLLENMSEWSMMLQICHE